MTAFIWVSQHRLAPHRRAHETPGATPDRALRAALLSTLRELQHRRMTRDIRRSRRSGEIFWDESFMALLRSRNEADRLISKHTKQSLKPQPSSAAGSKPPLPRERFSPPTHSGR